MNKSFLEINYQFNSHITNRTENDFIQKVRVEIHCTDEEDYSELVGEVNFKIIHIDKTEEYGFDIRDVFDEYEYTFRHSQEFYNFDNNQFKDNLLNAFPDLDFINKICIIKLV